jgi:hypothetical protein
MSLDLALLVGEDMLRGPLENAMKSTGFAPPRACFKLFLSRLLVRQGCDIGLRV